MNEQEAVKELTSLGLTEYQSKVYAALAALGPSGVTEINRLSRVPRTKIYETLEELIAKGVVEFQPGRPIVYRAIRPALLIKRMADEYLDSAKKATALLEERYESITDRNEDMVWIVRGDATIGRKLAEFVAKARESIFAMESYPPFFIPSVRSLLKAASKRGMKVRAVCAGEKNQLRTGSNPESELIEYRAFSTTIRRRKGISEDGKEDEPLMKALGMAISGPYFLAVVDDIESFVIIRNSTDATRSTGLSAKIPGVPILQRIMFERLFSRRTIAYTRV